MPGLSIKTVTKQFGEFKAVKNIDLNRKVLADLAMNEPETFKTLVASVK